MKSCSRKYRGNLVTKISVLKLSRLLDREDEERLGALRFERAGPALALVSLVGDEFFEDSLLEDEFEDEERERGFLSLRFDEDREFCDIYKGRWVWLSKAWGGRFCWEWGGEV